MRNNLHGIPREQNSKELLDVCSHSNLPEKILEGLFHPELGPSRMEYLGSEFPFFHGCSRDFIESYLVELFSKFESLRKSGEFVDSNTEARKTYKDISELLIVSGVAELITAGDWSVNRMALAEKSHGLRKGGFYTMQNVLANRYSDDSNWQNPTHVHKGPGNGVLPRQLVDESNAHPDDIDWKQIGVGDKMYFPIEPILLRFIKPEHRDNPHIINFIQILASVLKIRLKKKWFKENDTRVEKLENVDAFCDVNDIFQELCDFAKDPSEEIGFLFSPDTGKIKTSGHFEYDTPQDLPLELQAVLMRLLGHSGEKTKKYISRGFRSFLLKRRKNISRRLENLRQIRNTIKKLGESGEINEILLRSIYEATNRNFEPKNSHTKNYILRKLESYIEEYSGVVGATRETLKRIGDFGDVLDIPEHLLKEKFGDTLSVFDSNIDSVDLLEEFFNTGFFDQVIGVDRGEDAINLNRETEMYFGDFSLGYFTDIPDLVPGPVHVFSGTRSDSHEDSETFKQDIKQNLEQLVPGGVLTTDGVKESFSCIYRFQEITEVLKELGEKNFKAEVVVHKTTRRPISVFIQKKHPKGYLNKKEKKKFFDANIEFESLEETKGRPYIRVVNKVRRRLLEMTKVGREKGSVDIFQKLQGIIKNSTEKTLMNMALGKEESGYFDSLLEAYTELSNLDVAPEVWNTEETIKRVGGNQLSETTRQMLHDEVLVSLLKKHKAKIVPELDLEVLSMIHGFGDIEEYKKYLRQQIRKNDETNILSSDDVKRVIADVEADVEQTLHTYEGELSARENKSLNVLEPGNIYVFPRYGDGEKGEYSDINRRYNISTHQLPNNTEFIGRDEFLKEKILTVKERMGMLKNRVRKQALGGSFKPICFISYQDCITNEFMIEQLVQLFGSNWVRENVLILPMSFRPHDEVSPDVIRHLQHIQDSLEVYYRNGGIIIGGGSWTDAYDTFGKSFKEHIGLGLLEALESNNNLRQLAVCASYQIMADLIGEKHYKGLIVTKPGMAQFGATNIGVWKAPDDSHPRHEVFQGFPDYFTGSMTHTGWVCDYRSSKEKEKGKLRFIAGDVLSGNPIAYSAINDRILGIQWHPEIDMTSRSVLARLEKELKGYRGFFENNFHVGPGRVMHNFKQAIEGQVPAIRANSGKFVLGNTLEFLSRRIK